MKWILVFVMFNSGLHYAQSQPDMYSNYADCNKQAVQVKKQLLSTRPNDDAYAIAFCVSLPTDA